MKKANKGRDREDKDQHGEVGERDATEEKTRGISFFSGERLTGSTSGGE